MSNNSMSDDEFYKYQREKQKDHYKEIMEIRQSANKILKNKQKEKEKPDNIWGKFKQFFLGA